MNENNIVEVRYRSGWLDYFVNTTNLEIKPNQNIIVKVDRGEEIVEVLHTSITNDNLDKNFKEKKLKPVLRIASEKDLKSLAILKDEEVETSKKFNKIKSRYPFNMRLLRSIYQFDKNRVTFFFSADKRIDFRAFVRELASVFRTRIELYQTSGRDQTKWISGFGMCGKRYCCAQWMKHFDQVTIKTAKDQNLSNNLSKVSGPCGRLLCCLNFEENFYEEKVNSFPTVGDKIYYLKHMMYVYKNDFLKDQIYLASDNTQEFEIVSLKTYKELMKKQNEYRKKNKKRRYGKNKNSK